MGKFKFMISFELDLLLMAFGIAFEHLKVFHIFCVLMENFIFRFSKRNLTPKLSRTLEALIPSLPSTSSLLFFYEIPKKIHLFETLMKCALEKKWRLKVEYSK